MIAPRFASYREGGHYDWHVDVALMSRIRTDLSFTICLSDKDSYEGGQLEIEMPNGSKTKFKGEKGVCIIYPSGLLHKVHRVTSGERRVIV